MSWSDLYNILYNPHIFVSAVLGAVIGLEREIRGKDPSLRTFSYICMGSCLFCMVSRYSVIGSPVGDPSRIAAQILTGIGFLGAGAIFRSPRGVTGLTTAALMWVTAGIGMAVGFDHFALATVATLNALLVSFALNLIHEVVHYFRPEEPDPSYRRSTKGE